MRVQSGAVWGSWFKAQLSQAEQDARYARNTLGAREKIVSLGSVSGSLTLDCTAGSIFTMTPTADITFSSMTGSAALVGVGETYTIIVRQGATVRAVAGPPFGGIWIGPTPVQTANKATVYTAVYLNESGGGQWLFSATVQS
jgi:hypothetical protein